MHAMHDVIEVCPSTHDNAIAALPAGIQASIVPAFHFDFAKDSSTTHGASPVSDKSAATTLAHANDACCVHPVPGWVPGAPHGEQPGHIAFMQFDVPGYL